MRSSGVLVLGSSENSALLEALFAMGLSPLVREVMAEALGKLRRESLAAVVVDRGRSDVDVLEFLLNVRDIDERVPVVILGRSPTREEDRMLQERFGATILSHPGNRERLASAMRKTLLAKKG